MMKFDKHGIWYEHAKGTQFHDEVCWVWPWKRKGNNNKRYYSITFEGSFESLKELDQTWLNYVKACRRGALMSHANGEIRFNDNLILFYEYDGTCDIALSALYETYEEMDKNWRNQPNNRCSCGRDEEVEIATDYGNGFYWQGKACKFCKAITKNRMPFEYDEENFIDREDGLPEWWI